MSLSLDSPGADAAPRMDKALSMWIVNQFATPSKPGGTRQYEIVRQLVERGQHVTFFLSGFNTLLRTHQRTKPSRSIVRERIDDFEWRWLYATPYQMNDWRRYFDFLDFSSCSCSQPRDCGVPT